MKIYNLIEVANVHGGEFDHFLALVDDYAEFSEKFGIKFQPFKFDRIASPGFSWYETYQKLFFSPEQWASLIQRARLTKDVWLDIFDTYSAEILEANIADVFGIKMQSSVLENKEVLGSLANIDLTSKQLIINIAARSLAEIETIAGHINNLLKPPKLYLQAGFQAYPTELADSGLAKIEVLRKHFPDYGISFADHVDGASEESRMLPVTAALLGATLIEKHVRAESREPLYDQYSSISLEGYRAYVQLLDRYLEARHQPFINAREQTYLANSIQVPLLAKDIQSGQTLDLSTGFVFRRSGKQGLPISKLSELATTFHIAAADKPAGETLTTEDLRRASVGTLIACRLKSSRLPRKALAPIGVLPSVERCIKSALTFENINFTCLATSTTEEDAELSHYTYHPSVGFYQGHPEDVIQRFLDVADTQKLDIIVRITADMPYVSGEICRILLKSHFASGADYTTARHAPVGANLEIMSVPALRRIKQFFPSANYSEYMTFYFTSNSNHFRLNVIDLPELYHRNYRLTLDYQEDLDMFNQLEAGLAEQNKPVSLENVIEYLDANPEVAAINGHITLKYKTDPELIETLRRHTTIPSS